MEPIQMRSKIGRWAKHGGKIKKFGNGSSNSHAKKRTIFGLLVDQAVSLGWLNGERLERKKR